MQNLTRWASSEIRHGNHHHHPDHENACNHRARRTLDSAITPARPHLSAIRDHEAKLGCSRLSARRPIVYPPNDTIAILRADVSIPAGGANGMLVTQGSRFAGWGLDVQGWQTNLYDEPSER
jgi:hypothetical protein